MFFVQVGDKSSVRNNSLTLIVLPSPHFLVMLRECADVIRTLLLMSGDVELNPRPNTEANSTDQMLKKILKEQTKTNETLKDLTCNHKHIETTVEGIKQRIETMEKVLGRLNHLEHKLAECDQACQDTNKLLLSLGAKVDDLGNRSRRNNLIIYGVSEEPNEDNRSLEDKVKKTVFKDLLDLEVRTIERIYRIGAKRGQSPRPVILRVFDFSEKSNILSHCFKKATQISIREDFSLRIRELRSKLWHSAEGDKATGCKVSLVYDKLKFDGKTFVWDAQPDHRVELSRSMRKLPKVKDTQTKA